MATLRDWIAQTPEKVIDFTRYDLEAQEPGDPEPGKPICNWSLMNRLNQKGMRPQDVPMDKEELYPEEQEMIKRRYPVLLTKEHPQRKKTNYVFKRDYFKAVLFRKSCWFYKQY